MQLHCLRRLLILSASLCPALIGSSLASAAPLAAPAIFPLPLEVRAGTGVFEVNERTSILLSERSGETDEFLAHWLRHELIARHRTPVEIVRTRQTQADRGYILIGDLSNPLVRREVGALDLVAALQALGDEGYILAANENRIVVGGNTQRGAVIGFQSLRQIVSTVDGRVVVPQLLVRDAPRFPFRAILPQGVDNLLVPVCLSSTHVAWGTIRLEPTWMNLCESAGYAAALAIQNKVTPAQLDPDLLLRRLATSDVMLSFFNDLDVSSDDPRVPSAQYFGTKGFFASYDAKLDAPLTEAVKAAWQEGFEKLPSGTLDPMQLAKAVHAAEAQPSPATGQMRGDLLLAEFSRLAQPR